MNKKLRNYIDLMFDDVPTSAKSRELKEELLGNANDRYEDYISMGKSESEAYGLAVSSMGDMDELIAKLKPTQIQNEEIKHYRKRNAAGTAIAVVLYILSPLTLILVSFFSNNSFSYAIGMLVLLCFVAIATGIIIYTQMTTPKEVKDYNKSMEDREWDNEMALVSKRNRSLCSSIRNIMWITVTAIYLGISFFTHAWHITWIIWIIASAIDHMIILAFRMKEDKDYDI